MSNLKKLFSVLFSAILLFSATTTSSVAIDKLHFVIGGGAIVVVDHVVPISRICTGPTEVRVCQKQYSRQ